MQNFRVLGAPPPNPQTALPLRISGYAPAYDVQIAMFSKNLQMS